MEQVHGSEALKGIGTKCGKLQHCTPCVAVDLLTPFLVPTLVSHNLKLSTSICLNPFWNNKAISRPIKQFSKSAWSGKVNRNEFRDRCEYILQILLMWEVLQIEWLIINDYSRMFISSDTAPRNG